MSPCGTHYLVTPRSLYSPPRGINVGRRDGDLQPEGTCRRSLKCPKKTLVWGRGETFRLHGNLVPDMAETKLRCLHFPSCLLASPWAICPWPSHRGWGLQAPQRGWSGTQKPCPFLEVHFLGCFLFGAILRDTPAPNLAKQEWAGPSCLIMESSERCQTPSWG